MKLLLTNFSLRRPWLTIMLTLFAVVLFGSQFPKVRFDNDPENMLAKDEYVRVFHHQVKEKFALYDFVIVGIVNETHPDGIFNVDTLNRIDRLTRELLNLRRGETGLPKIVLPARDGQESETIPLDLSPGGRLERILNKAFNHDPNDLFNVEGQSVIIGRELIAPSVVDNIKQADLGSLKLEYLMERPPGTPEEAQVIRDDAMGNPLYAGTLVAEDEKAVCLYIPIAEKIYSYNVANLVRHLTADWPAEDALYITGLPVAEDTFGIEMLVEMATSAPLAFLAIFLLLLLFFRKLTLIVAPMAVAMFSVVCTMGLLIGLGFDVHIMSSMIAIFLMPIAVADSVHILSEFYDTYHRFRNKAETVRFVIGHLFRPMLFTSLTTMAGFASLGMTPIPPVQVFGLHIAFGVAVAWILSMTLIPAYIMVAVPESRLQSLVREEGKDFRRGPMSRFLENLGGFSYRRWRLIVGMSLVILAISVFGISRIQVNDNPVKWFTRQHEVRIADQVLNDHFGGTYTAYLTLAATRPGVCECAEKAAVMSAEAERRFGSIYPEETRTFLAAIEQLKNRYGSVTADDARKAFVELVHVAEKLDAGTAGAWDRLADEVNYLDPSGLTLDGLRGKLGRLTETPEDHRRVLLRRLEDRPNLLGTDLLDAAVAVCDEFAGFSFKDFVFEMEAELTAPLFKQPDMLRYVAGLQNFLKNGDTTVGKTNSAVDALKKAAYELQYVAPPADAGEAEAAAFRERNQANFAVPDSAAAVAQVFVQLEGMKKKDSLFHLVTRDYQEANVWFQLTSGDNKDMESVVRTVKNYLADNPPPVPLRAEWAGLTYLNVVWQDKMVWGMIGSLASSFVVVLVMMMLLFRSVLFGILAMVPLTLTISFIYGLIGLAGKDYDMPVAVLSALTLGLSVDFAIHFLQRARDLQSQFGSWRKAAEQMFKEPAMAISRNAIVIAVGFTPLLVAPLVPYRTVGFFLASIMVVSWLATLFLLPALLTPLRKRVFQPEDEENEEEPLTEEMGDLTP